MHQMWNHNSRRFNTSKSLVSWVKASSVFVYLQQHQAMTQRQHRLPLDSHLAPERLLLKTSHLPQGECRRRTPPPTWPQLPLVPPIPSHPFPRSSLCRQRSQRRWAPTPPPPRWSSPPHLRGTAASLNTVSWRNIYHVWEILWVSPTA